MNAMESPLTYTICFAFSGSNVLVIFRNKEPNLHKWNGLGGKIEGKETPRENIIREMKEEAELDLTKAESLQFSGVITWKSTRKEGLVYGGMYAFIARFDKNYIFEDRVTREGLLSWKKIEWLCKTHNLEVAENIPLFLPPMLSEKMLSEYVCTYVFGELTAFEKRELTPAFLQAVLE